MLATKDGKLIKTSDGKLSQCCCGGACCYNSGTVCVSAASVEDCLAKAGAAGFGDVSFFADQKCSDNPSPCITTPCCYPCASPTSCDSAVQVGSCVENGGVPQAEGSECPPEPNPEGEPPTFPPDAFCLNTLTVSATVSGFWKAVHNCNVGGVATPGQIITRSFDWTKTETFDRITRATYQDEGCTTGKCFLLSQNCGGGISLSVVGGAGFGNGLDGPDSTIDIACTSPCDGGDGCSDLSICGEGIILGEIGYDPDPTEGWQIAGQASVWIRTDCPHPFSSGAPAFFDIFADSVHHAGGSCHLCDAGGSYNFTGTNSGGDCGGLPDGCELETGGCDGSSCYEVNYDITVTIA